MPLTNTEIDAAVPVGGTPSRSLTNAALKELVVDVAGKASTTHTHALANITDAGTAAAADTGTSAGNVPVLDGSGRLPAVDGSQLTGLAGGGDMAAATFDPQGVNGDAFARANHTGEQAISTITGLGTAAAADTGTGSGQVPLLDGDGDIPLSMLGKAPSGGASNDVVDAIDSATITLGAFNRIADGASVTVPDPATNEDKTFGVWLEDGGTTAALAGGLVLTLTTPREARTFASDGTSWLEYSGAEIADPSGLVTVVSIADAQTLEFGRFNEIADGASVTVPAAAGNKGKTFGVWLEAGGTAASLITGLTLTLDTPREARTFSSDGTTWLEYFGPEATGVSSSAPNVIRLTGGSEAPTLAGYNNAIVIIDSGTQILTAPISGTDVYYFQGINKSANAATIGGVIIPQNEVFSVLVDGTDMTARNIW